MTQEVADILQALDDALAQKDFGARFVNVFTSDAVIETNWGLFRGANEIEMALLPLTLALPGAELLPESHVASGPNRAIARWVLRAPSRAEGLLGPQDAELRRVHVMADLHLQDGRIARAVVISDAAVLYARESLPRLHNISPRETPRPENSWAVALADHLAGVLGPRGQAAVASYAPGASVIWPGQPVAHGVTQAAALWFGLRDAIPQGRLSLATVLGGVAPLSPPIAAARWTWEGTHDGWGAFDAPTGASLRVDGMTMVELGPDGIVREYTQFDRLAVKAQMTAVQV